MSNWLCQRCLELPEGEGLEHHIQAHSRTTVWSHAEVRQAVHEVRATAAHCEGCKERVMRDVVERDLEVFGTVPLVRFDGQPLDLKPFYAQLQQTMAGLTEQFQKAWSSLRDAGLTPEEPPADPKTRALWARKNRNTGPSRPSGQAARRPRRHK